MLDMTLDEYIQAQTALRIECILPCIRSDDLLGERKSSSDGVAAKLFGFVACLHPPALLQRNSRLQRQRSC